jgi:3-hydroxyisobutyrate dehydrogenase-like beta-hydroxyacid dehydrogenase
LLTPASAIALIGFGDKGRRVAVPLAQRGVAVRAWDRQLAAASSSRQMCARIEAAGVDPASTLVEALRGARLVIVAVDAAACRELAQAAAPLLAAGQVYLDLSGCSTEVHQGNALLVERSGAHHVAGQLDTPLLLAGARAASLAAALATLGLPARAIDRLPPCSAADYHDAPAKAANFRDAAASSAPLRRGELP